MEQKRAGFTLIEVLVVLAILALLISILLPVVTDARSAAARVSCATNMHQVALAISNYAASHKGMLPGSGHMGSREPFAIPALGPDPYSGFQPANLADPSQLDELIKVGFIPAAQKDAFIFDPAAAGGEMTIVGWGERRFAHYWWNPHPAERDLGNDASALPVEGYSNTGAFKWGGAIPRWTRLAQIPKGRILGCDIINAPSSTAHRGSGRSTKARWNLAFPDGHVSTVTCADLFVKTMDLKRYPPYGPVIEWMTANDAIRVLELLDQGRDPRNMFPGLKGQYPWEDGLSNQYYPPCVQNSIPDDVQK